MSMEEALQWFGFETLEEASQEEVTKRFRGLMRKHHPDLCYSDDEQRKKNEEASKQINSAHELLVKLLTEIETLQRINERANRVEVFALIPFEKLFSLYNGEVITLRSKDKNKGDFTLTKGNIKANRIMLCIEVGIMVNGVRTTFSKIVPYIYTDEYTVNCDIPVRDDSVIEVRVEAYGKVVNVALKNDTTRLKLRYNNKISLSIEMSKKIVEETV